MTEGQSMWTPCPYFHVGGIGVLAAALTRAGAMLTMTHFEGPAALDHIERLHAEHLFPAFPPLTLGLLRAGTYRPERIPFVETVLNVSPPETQQLIDDLLPEGTVLLTDFGMTEGSGMITVTPREAGPADRIHSNGVPLPGTEVRITDPADPQAVLRAELPGEIQFRGINAFCAYYKDPAATTRTILPGGWVRTGDQGWMDRHGQLHFTGRIKDILKVGGENVSPAEVEAYLSTHPAVKMAQVVGRHSADYGEEPVAFVELMPGAGCAAEDLIGFCTGHLASYKVPRDVVFVTEWPMSATKIQKFRLREMLSPPVS
jgi:acyl-CoA synthetase (AMP-forming)/AMP-acid ligase II